MSITKADWKKEAEYANQQKKEAEKKIKTCEKVIVNCKRIIEVADVTHEFYLSKAK